MDQPAIETCMPNGRELQSVRAFVQRSLSEAARGYVPMIDPRRVVGGLLGVAVGDALGLPVEFESRTIRQQDPVTGMRGEGVHLQPAGTWSDETSLTFCTVETLLLNDYSVDRLGEAFARWVEEGWWSPNGKVFDLPEETAAAIGRIIRGIPATQSGAAPGERGSEGNGALARSLPIALAFSRWSIPLMIAALHESSAITHPNPVCLMASGIYGLVVRNLAFKRSTLSAYRRAAEDAKRIYVREPWKSVRNPYRRLLRGTVGEVPEGHIVADSFVAHTLEAALWAMQSTRSFSDCVLRAVNLGEDADTVGAVAGGLAGVAYGIESIPEEWIDALARKDELLEVAERFSRVVSA
ncbi:MAG: ADP-ribosylglycohydrolase family protein [Candidatus Eisenbacteria bacterium]|nr:ADP-ribosylglycohydrolase family protein [Candidatus Latescibacterota bacterium]MBD3303186.1 ADP-ribosylglycohydrolase family protein [Candidatus Eisenbacteria bacterium]